MNYHELIHTPILEPGVAKLVERCAKVQTPVLILGEQGTGKDLIAKIIHQLGNPDLHHFCRVDCRLLKKEGLLAHLLPFLEKIHFGLKPATLYLDEVGHLNAADQLKLLELIEDGGISNGTERKAIQNLRILSSSSENLKEKVDLGEFSEDLLLKLKTLSIHLSPLRDRRGEIGAIAQSLLEWNHQKQKVRNLKISKEVLDIFENYWWPGNLRELEQVLLRGALLAEGDEISEKDLFLGPDFGGGHFVPFTKKMGGNKGVSLNQSFPRGSSNGLSLSETSLFFLELVHRIKNPLVSIKTFTQLLRDKFNDLEFRNTFYRIVTEDIEKIDAVLSGLLDYIRINHPIEKRDTVHAVIEEVLKKHWVAFETKQIKVYKKFEEGLPETILHEEQLRYVLNSLLQYAIPSIPAQGSLGVLTKSLVDQKGSEAVGFTPKDKKLIEILIVFTGYKKPMEPLGTLFGLPSTQAEEPADIEIRLIKEMIERHQGAMTFEVNPKKLRTLVSLKLPVERRKVMTYRTTPD